MGPRWVWGTLVAILLSGVAVQTQAKDEWKDILNGLAADAATNLAANYDPKGLEQALRNPIPKDLAERAMAMDQELVASSTVVTDAAATARVNKIVSSLVSKLHNKGPAFTVRILKSDEVNAFTSGGPYMYFYTAILDSVKSDDELAGIVAHELGHVDAAHCARDGGIIGIGSMAAQLLGEKNDLGKAGAGASATFGRGHESEADTLAVIYASRAGYDPRRFMDFFERMMQQDEAAKAQAVALLKRIKADLDASKPRMEAARKKVKTGWSPQTGCQSAKTELEARRARFDAAKAKYESAKTPADYQTYTAALNSFNIYVPLYNDCVAYDREVANNNRLVKNYNAQLAYTKAIHKAPSPWMVDHPFDAKRKARVLELADYLQGKTGRDAVTDPITRRVMETIERVEGKPVR